MENQVILEIIFGAKSEIIEEQLVQNASESAANEENKKSLKEQIYIIEEVTVESHASNPDVNYEPTIEDPDEPQK